MHSFPHICIICLPRMPLGFVLIALNACVKCLACFSIVSDQIYLIRIQIQDCFINPDPEPDPAFDDHKQTIFYTRKKRRF
jgi:hypothetical protein